MTDDQTPEDVFDPETHTVDEVNAYLAAGVDTDERERVLAAEKDGKARTGILDGPQNGEPADDEPQADDGAPSLREAAQAVADNIETANVDDRATLLAQLRAAL